MAKRGIHTSELWRKENNTVSENYLNQAFLITALGLGFLTSGLNQIASVLNLRVNLYTIFPKYSTYVGGLNNYKTSSTSLTWKSVSFFFAQLMFSE